MKPVVSWIVVADGARARVLVHAGPGNLSVEWESAQYVPPTRDIDADRPGRAFDSTGRGRHAMEPPTDPHRDRKRRFAREIARVLEDGRTRGAYQRLYLVAPPRALGDLRAELTGEVGKRVAGELDKDFTHLPVLDLPSRLGAILVV